MKRNILSLILGFTITLILTSNIAIGGGTQYFIVKNPKLNTWVKTEQEFNAITLEFLDGQKTAEVKFPNESTEKYHLEIDGENEGDNFSELFLTEYTNYFWIESDGKVNVHLYNNEKKKKTLFAGSLYVEGLKIISRQEWGADETIRYNYNDETIRPNVDVDVTNLSSSEKKCQDIISKNPDEYVYDRVVNSEGENNLLWPRQYSKKIQKIVIHHTAESDGSSEIPGGDKIRSIYYYHAKTKGWGDIGYNFIIDQEGNIYEGRSGGDYIVGGHVYCSNINTMGISLMGNFVKNQPTKQQVASLAKLLSVLSKKYNLNLSESNEFHGKTASTLLGHRDLGATACPGDNFYNLLPLFRKHFSVSGIDFGISEKSREPASAFSAQISGRPTKISMEPMSSQNITLTFKNTGDVTWERGTWLYVSSNDNNKLWVDSIIIDKNYVAADLRESKVLPGGTGHFDIKINTGIEGGVHMLEFTPIINAERKIESATIVFPVEIKDTTFDYEFVKAVNPENPFYYGQKKEAKVLLKNIGSTTWYRSGKFPITLASPNNKKSSFADEKDPTTFAWMDQNEIKPGQIASFNFEIYGGFEEGTFEVPFVPRIDGEKFLKDVGMKFILKVKKPNYKAQILYNNLDLSFKPGETKTIKIGLKNFSDVDWQENQISIRVVKNEGIKFQQNTFYFYDFIPMNKSGYTNLTITAPIKSGTFSAKLQTLANGKKFNVTRWLYLPITVEEPELKGKIAQLIDPNITIPFGRTKEIKLKLRNEGNVTWERNGSNAIQLVSLKPKSLLVSQTWISTNIVSYMEEDSIAPKEVATFLFSVRLNSKTNVQERFLVKSKSLGIIEGSQFIIKVSPEKLNETIPIKPAEIKSYPKEVEDISSTDGDLSFQERLRNLRLQKENNYVKNNLSEINAPKKIEKQTKDTSISESKDIRILLSFPHTSANVLSSNLSKVYVDGKLFRELNKGDSLWTRKDGTRMIVSVNGEEKSYGSIIRVESINGYLTLYNWKRSPSWNQNIFDNTFEEVLEFRLVDNEIAVINELAFEKYLSGCAEIPEDEPHEKRKTMAVLARSYARHYTETNYKKFPDKPYDGSDSPDVFQKYLGYNYSLRSPEWQTALQETKDEVLTYNDEILRTAYFSCSNGKTKTPVEAGWNSEYYSKVSDVYKSVDDSFGMDKGRFSGGQCGHGVGLSGSGAKALADQGKDYKEILNYYYQGVEIERK